MQTAGEIEPWRCDMTLEEAKAKIEVLEAVCGELRNEINELRTLKNDIQTQLQLKTQDIEALRNSLDSAISDISVLSSDLGSVSARLTAIESNGLGTQVHNMEATVKIQGIKVARLERERKYGGF